MVILSVAYISQSQASPWTCEDIRPIWDSATDLSRERALNASAVARFRSLLQSCQGRVSPSLSLANFNRLAERADINEFQNREREFRLGLRSDVQRIRAVGLRAGIASHRLDQINNSRRPRQSCQSYDYRDRLPPIRNQGSLDWCFGHVAADLASFRLGQSVSAYDSAILGHANQNSQLFGIVGLVRGDYAGFENGGQGPMALREMLSQGVCLSSQLRENDLHYERGVRELRQELERTFAMAASVQETGNTCVGLCEVTMSERIRQAAPQLSQAQIQTVIRQSSVNDFMSELQRQACRNRTPLTGSVRKHKTTNVETLYRVVNEQLASGNIVGVAYDADVISGRERSSSSDVGHESSIVGQRWNSQTERCELLLRNSWGADCSGGRREITCESDGHQWIPAYTLLDASNEVYYLQ